jgi:hypothetical protein
MIVYHSPQLVEQILSEGVMNPFNCENQSVPSRVKVMKEFYEKKVLLELILRFSKHFLKQ